jgi:hypothetical protein
MARPLCSKSFQILLSSQTDKCTKFVQYARYTRYIISFQIRRSSLRLPSDLQFRRSAQIYQNLEATSKLQAPEVVTWSKCHPEDPQILGATVEKLVDWAKWRPGFVHPWFRANDSFEKKHSCN